MIMGLVGRGLMVIGLSRENVQHLEEGQPINVDVCSRLCITNLDHAQVRGLLVFFGDTEDDCVRILREKGLITEESTVMDSRTMKQ